MNIIALDFETYFTDEYGLGRDKLTTEEYVRDARFRPHGCGIRQVTGGDSRSWWTHTPEHAFNNIDWKDTAALCHHAHFDGLILEHHYGVKPARYLCTLSMGRGMLGNHLKLGLESLAEHFNLSPKSVPYNLFKNKYWHELTPDVQEQVAEGCCHDVDLTVQIFQYLMAGYISPSVRSMKAFPAEELALIDLTIRMFTRPRIIGDTEMLGKLYMDELAATTELLVELGLLDPASKHDPVHRDFALKALRSDAKFAELLRAEGVEPGEKVTPAGNVKYAFAKSDPFMKDLLEGVFDEASGADEWTPAHDRLRLLGQARVKAKSNLEQTRAERLGWMSTRGPMCVYINYCGAHTTRDSGGDKLNWQNFKRASPLRKAQKAPKGQLVGTVDAAQIECRMLNTIVGQDDIAQAFRERRDLYCERATQFYEREITKADKPERGTGKQLELSCGFGAGEYTIQITAAKGTYGPPVKLTLEQALRAKALYRQTHPFVEKSWKVAGQLIKELYHFHKPDFYTPFEIQVDKVNGFRRIVAPNGMALIYDSLEWHTNEKGESYWRIRTRSGYAKLYGAKVIENAIQFISRVHTMQVAVKVERETGLWPWLRNHDELAYPIDDNQYAEETMKWINEQLRTPPSWLPQIPLDAEWTLGARYEK